MPAARKTSSLEPPVSIRRLDGLVDSSITPLVTSVWLSVPPRVCPLLSLVVKCRADLHPTTTEIRPPSDHEMFTHGDAHTQVRRMRRLGIPEQVVEIMHDAETAATKGGCLSCS